MCLKQLSDGRYDHFHCLGIQFMNCVFWTFLYHVRVCVKVEYVCLFCLGNMACINNLVKSCFYKKTLFVKFQIKLIKKCFFHKK